MSLINITTQNPGSFGINTQNNNEVLDPRWCITANNLVVSGSNRLQARRGTYLTIDSTPIPSTSHITTIYEYTDSINQTIMIICDSDGKLWKDDGSRTLTDITGTVPVTNGNWKFQTFNNKCIGFHELSPPIVLSSTTGTFAPIVFSSGSVAKSADGLAAFGRLWVLEGDLLKYSASLDETNWTTGGGSFDLKTVWPGGEDDPVALAEYNGFLLVFGKRSTIVYNNPWSPVGGGSLDTTKMSLVEGIKDIGCVSRDSVVHVGPDLFFLSNSGVRAFSRTIQEKSMPHRELTVHVREHVVSDVDSHIDKNTIKAVYNPSDGFYLLILPTSKECYCLDVKQFLQDGSSKITTWDFRDSSGSSPLTCWSATYTKTNKMYLGLDNNVTIYSGFRELDSPTVAGYKYTCSFLSAWHPIRQDIEQHDKILKKLAFTIFGGANQASLKWLTNFESTGSSVGISISTNQDVAYYTSAPPIDPNAAFYAVDKYGVGAKANTLQVRGNRKGQFWSFGVDVEVEGSETVLQSFTTKFRLGKLHG